MAKLDSRAAKEHGSRAMMIEVILRERYEQDGGVTSDEPDAQLLKLCRQIRVKWAEALALGIRY